MTATFERGDTIVEIKGVPASICQICGEEYVSDQVAGKLLKQAEEAEKAGVL
jgi:YgiT-type zinc finger domain-containing protein